MYFNSIAFGIFFPTVFLLYWSLRNHRVPRHWLLLVSSYVFYGWWDWRFLGLIFFSTVLDWVAGNGIHRSEDPRVRKRFLLLSLIGNLGVLGFFKYFNFFEQGVVMVCRKLGFEVDPWVLKVLLPPGISFYTFQTLSYSIDIHRRKLEPARTFLDFAVYVAFFPQLVAGPILRASYFLPQMLDRMKAVAVEHVDGFYLILRGLAKKIILADALGRGIVQPIFGGAAGIPDSSAFTSMDVMLGAWGFAFQVYLDFSAYSDIAIGAAQLLGFKIPDNFRSPFQAPNPRDLWRRWHISLTTWFRDYLFFPLGGSRQGFSRTCWNILVVFTISGLWHGAGWHFVIWGFANGLWLVLYDMWERWVPMPDPKSRAGRSLRPLGVLFTFTIFAFMVVLFRSGSFWQVREIYARMFSFTVGFSVPFRHGMILLFAVAWITHLFPERLTDFLRKRFTASPALFQGMVAALLFMVFAFFQEMATPFIYFQF